MFHYLVLKNKIKNINLDREPYKSYHLKTVLLELTTQSCEGIENAYLFTKSLIKRLSEAYENVVLPNFFNPSQNLLENEKENFKGIVNTLDKLVMTMEQPENISYSKLIVDTPYNSPLRFESGNLAVTALGKVEHTTKFPILDCESNPIPPRSFSFMLFTELYNVFLCPSMDRKLFSSW